MKIITHCLCCGSIAALSLLFAAGPSLASSGKGNNVSAPARPLAMREVVLLREEIRPHGESLQSRKIRSAKKHPGKRGFRSERGLRAKRPRPTRNRLVVVPGEFAQPLSLRAVPPGK